MKVYKSQVNTVIHSLGEYSNDIHEIELPATEDHSSVEFVLKSDADAELKAKDLEIKMLREQRDKQTALLWGHPDSGSEGHIKEIQDFDQEIREALNDKQR